MYISLKQVNLLMFAMEKCEDFFGMWREVLNIIQMSVDFQRLKPNSISYYIFLLYLYIFIELYIMRCLSRAIFFVSAKIFPLRLPISSILLSNVIQNTSKGS
jgi:hypothetical protein